MEKHWLEILPYDSEAKSVRIDSYWSRVFLMKGTDGRFLFPQLSALIKAILSLSHGNAGPEQGFSVNKSIIAVHGTRLGEDVLIALRRVKHRLLQVGGVKNFKITRPLLESIKQSRNRYEEELKAIEQKKTNRAKVKTSQEKNELLDIDNEMRKIERGIEVADKAISDGSKKLEQHLASKAKKLRSDNELIQMGHQ